MENLKVLGSQFALPNVMYSVMREFEPGWIEMFRWATLGWSRTQAANAALLEKLSGILNFTLSLLTTAMKQ
ncbi:hypothetical protein BZL54_24035 [Burkholderia ubonensis subsp. mesacidophila]|uniref:Uncharacterized protein n=1 Tax=Burkholderia ubonensis subsp. mesacidophila TaxID=265293 RepID=A0A2A4FB30_9BURK|nr:hypothetical protein BZL54_24035 [Burkholderia ubonensis subsp. mesacidophila]